MPQPAVSSAESIPHNGGGALVPQHVAIIMDGNGRWAKARGLPRQLGHAQGMEAARKAVQFAQASGIQFLTLFAFSSENWRRPKDEIQELLGLLKHFINKDLATLHSQNVRVRIIGAREGLSNELAQLLDNAELKTKNNQGLTLIIAFNYGARDELTRAVKAVAHQIASGALQLQDIDESHISAALDTAQIPDPDVIIRTSGEQRISNFLLWQAAYAEFVFLECLWPDFDAAQFQQALSVYAMRERRFGGA